MVATVHDEIIFTVPKDRVEECRLLKEEAVVELNELLGWSIPMRLSWTVASNFSEVK
jgi:DNA polymerase I-like protein with 3'-5' exonuclease and polymerase domains